MHYIDEKKFVKGVSKDLFPILYKKHGCGFQDGGCLIFSVALSEVLKDMKIDNEIQCVGRRDHRDHFVVKVKTPKGDMFIDSDGLNDEDNLIEKTRDELEPIHEDTHLEIVDWDGNRSASEETPCDIETIDRIKIAFNRDTLIFIKEEAGMFAKDNYITENMDITVHGSPEGWNILINNKTVRHSIFPCPTESDISDAIQEYKRGKAEIEIRSALEEEQTDSSSPKANTLLKV